jgi:hypothetical protein
VGRARRAREIFYFRRARLLVFPSTIGPEANGGAV